MNSFFIGTAIGLLDCLGFFYTVKFLFVNKTIKNPFLFSFLEIGRLIACGVILVTLLRSNLNLSIYVVLGCAIAFSFGGKFFLILRKTQ